MKTLLPSVVLAIFLGMLSTKAEAVIIDGVNWTFNWDGNVLPTQATPPFDNFGTAFTTDGFTSIAPAGGGAGMSDAAWAGGNLGAGPASTLEFRVRVLAQGSQPDTYGAALFAGWNGVRFNVFLNALDTPFVDFGGSGPSLTNTYEIDTADWHTYRMVFTPGGSEMVSLYIDDVFRLSTSGGPGFANAVQFANYTGWVSASASSEWDYIRWTNAGAFAPVPEPSTFALLGAVGVAALAFRRRASRRS